MIANLRLFPKRLSVSNKLIYPVFGYLTGFGGPMSLGKTLISALSGFITAFGLYVDGQVSFIGGVGAYSLTGILVTLILATALYPDSRTARN